jgi:hypothetical protein
MTIQRSKASILIFPFAPPKTARHSIFSSFREPQPYQLVDENTSTRRPHAISGDRRWPSSTDD